MLYRKEGDTMALTKNEVKKIINKIIDRSKGITEFRTSKAHMDDKSFSTYKEIYIEVYDEKQD